MDTMSLHASTAPCSAATCKHVLPSLSLMSAVSGLRRLYNTKLKINRLPKPRQNSDKTDTQAIQRFLFSHTPMDPRAPIIVEFHFIIFLVIDFYNKLEVFQVVQVAGPHGRRHSIAISCVYIRRIFNQGLTTGLRNEFSFRQKTKKLTHFEAIGLFVHDTPVDGRSVV
jgi:hypothetical protein